MNKQLVEIHNQTMYWVADNGGLRISDRIPTGYTEKFAGLMIEQFLEIAHSNLHPQAYAQILTAVQQRFEIT